MRRHPLSTLFSIFLGSLAVVVYTGLRLKDNPRDSLMLTLDAIFLFTAVVSLVLWGLGFLTWFLKRILISTAVNVAARQAGFRPTRTSPASGPATAAQSLASVKGEVNHAKPKT
jgi:hypothetical protein